MINTYIYIYVCDLCIDSGRAREGDNPYVTNVACQTPKGFCLNYWIVVTCGDYGRSKCEGKAKSTW